MGLTHEHQQPDRDSYINIEWSKVPGYTAVVEDEATMDYIFTQYKVEDHDYERAEYLLTHTAVLALKYCPALFEYMLYPNKMVIDQADWEAHWKSSTNYDYDSIMGYGSSEGIVFRKNADGSTSPIYQGGSNDYRRKGLSPADIAAVVDLYPPIAGSAAQRNVHMNIEENSGDWVYVGNWSAAAVSISPNYTTTIYNPAVAT
ncbi:hypothetical protein EJ03DRAFT_329848 [Teratosphaeria nubilosa]|uniref:Uncharacterized protein n=1 Tax=Teratosphaeria nubilosa TaxID=161662 RepID=A0A6G1L1E4_9PEZI|nr:hypothetical protein EJ03DRAFT_329848 [Teratosphaeria nubilosa]